MTQERVSDEPFKVGCNDTKDDGLVDLFGLGNFSLEASNLTAADCFQLFDFDLGST